MLLALRTRLTAAARRLSSTPARVSPTTILCSFTADGKCGQNTRVSGPMMESRPFGPALPLASRARGRLGRCVAHSGSSWVCVCVSVVKLPRSPRLGGPLLAVCCSSLMWLFGTSTSTVEVSQGRGTWVAQPVRLSGSQPTLALSSGQDLRGVPPSPTSEAESACPSPSDPPWHSLSQNKYINLFQIK